MRGLPRVNNCFHQLFACILVLMLGQVKLLDSTAVIDRQTRGQSQLGNSFSFDQFNAYHGQSRVYNDAGNGNKAKALNSPSSSPSSEKHGVTAVDHRDTSVYHARSAASVDAVNSEQIRLAAPKVEEDKLREPNNNNNNINNYNSSLELLPPPESNMGGRTPFSVKTPKSDNVMIVITELDGTITRVIDNRYRGALDPPERTASGPAVDLVPLTQSGLPASSGSSSSTRLESSKPTNNPEKTSMGPHSDPKSPADQSADASGATSNKLLKPSVASTSSTPKSERMFELISATNISGSLEKLGTSISERSPGDSAAGGQSTVTTIGSKAVSLISTGSGSHGVIGGSVRPDQGQAGTLEHLKGVQAVGGGESKQSSGHETDWDLEGNQLQLPDISVKGEVKDGFDVANLLQNLFGVNLKNPGGNNGPKGCIARLAGSDLVGSIVSSIVNRAVSAALQNCQSSARAQQSRGWFDLIPSLLSPGGRENIAGTIVGTVAQNCELQTRRTICRMLSEELASEQCNLCTVIALTFRPAAVNKCACQVVASVQGDVAGSIRRCVGSGIAGAVVREQFGGLITFPGC